MVFDEEPVAHRGGYLIKLHVACCSGHIVWITEDVLAALRAHRGQEHD